MRQHLILEDPALLDDYGRVRQEFRQTAQQLAQLPLDRAQLAALDAARRQREPAAPAAARAAAPGRRADAARRRLREARRGAQAMLDRDQPPHRARDRAAAGDGGAGPREVALPGARDGRHRAALAILFAVLIARPIRQLDQAIRQMGTADFTHAIEVNGPQDLRYLGQRLEWLRTRLHELEEQQNRFLRHVSHELKTPLTAVREGAELLRDNVGGELSPEQREIVRIVRENTLSLQKLIEDLLTYHQTRAMEPQTLGPVRAARRRRAASCASTSSRRSRG